MLLNIFRKIKGTINSLIRQELTNRLNQDCVSVFCNNCVGAMVSHDFGLRFNSPTVNLWMYPNHFIKLIQNIDTLRDDDLIEKHSLVKYPIGHLVRLDIDIHFQHYKDFKTAKDKWNERKKRINSRRIYAILVERDGCCEEDIKAFDKLNVYKKWVIVHQLHGNIKCEIKIDGYENDDEVGLITDLDSNSGRRIYDRLNWYAFWGYRRPILLVSSIFRKIANGFNNHPRI